MTTHSIETKTVDNVIVLQLPSPMVHWSSITDHVIGSTTFLEASQMRHWASPPALLHYSQLVNRSKYQVFPKRISRRRKWRKEKRKKRRKRRRRRRSKRGRCRGDRFPVPPRCLLRVTRLRICQFAAASAAGSVSSGSVRASVTRDLQHGGAQEKQKAQRCKRRIWARIAACREPANTRRDRSTHDSRRRARPFATRRHVKCVSADQRRTEWRRQTPKYYIRSLPFREDRELRLAFPLVSIKFAYLLLPPNE